MPEPEVKPQDQWLDLQPLIDLELNGLPENYRLPILLCDLEGKTIKEATQQLGWPQGTLAGRLARGRKLLAKRLASRGVVLSASSLAAVVSLNGASAGVPSSLTSSTAKAATMIAAGKATVAGVVPVKIAALMEGVTKVNQLKAAMGVLMAAVCLIGIGAAVVLGQQPDSPKKADPEAKRTEAEEAAVKAMQERLQGTWKCVSMQYGGVKSEPGLTYTIKGNTWETKLDGRVAQSGTFKLVDLDASPKQIDSVITFAEAEVVGERKGVKCEGIFMLDGDSLFMCASDDAAKAPRPEGFFTQEGDGCHAVQLKRVVAR
jgi:RNA polymerase sigma-70 factor (ECF subfamily)